MKRLMALALLFVGAALFAHAAPEKQAATERTGYTLTHSAGVGGLWVSPKERGPVGMLYSDRRDGGQAVLAFSIDGISRTGHPFAIATNSKEVYFQVIDEKNEVHHIPVKALLKLKEK